MEHTKAWVVEQSFGMFWGGSSHAVFLSKEEAECYNWLKNREKNTIESWHPYYSVIEVSVKTVDKTTKEYKTFIKERLAEIEKGIKERQNCAEKDNVQIEELSKTKAHYQSLL